MKTILFFTILLLILAGCGGHKNYRYQSTQSGGTKSDLKLNPYQVMGKTYIPTMVSIGEEFTGTASWYGKDFDGKKTANGEIYDMYAQTAAHKTLPMNTVLRVTNLKNQKATIVRVNDRGPFVDGRIIDLSFTAGKAIGIDTAGVAPVKLTVLGFEGTIPSPQVVKELPQSVQVKGFALQIGAYKNKAGADKLAKENSLVENRYSATVRTYQKNGEPFYRVMLEGFGSELEAKEFAIRSNYKGAFIVNME